MSKKGLAYVDWVISMGTFLIAVVAIFIFFKPGAVTEDKENLMMILENNFFNETKLTVKQTPLIVRRLADVYTDAYGNPQNALIRIQLSTAYGNTVTEPSSHSFQIANNRVFDCIASLCQNVKFIINYYPLNIHTTEFPDIKLSCIPQDSAYCDAVLGSTLDLEGVIDISSFSAVDYNELKTKWKFPKNNNFAVYINNNRLFTNNPEPSLQSDVHVKEVKYWKLDNYGKREPINVNLRVW